jgi:hypothetical protein
MTWLANRKIRKMTDPADGTLEITGTSGTPDQSATYQNFRFTGVVEAPGMQPTAVEVGGMAAPTAKWPQPGQRLPVTVDRANPDSVSIRWDEVLSGRGLAMAKAIAEETRLRTGLDPDVLSEAMREVDGSAPASPTAPAEPETTTAAPEQSRWETPQPADTVPAIGTVIAVRDVPLPAGFGPPGGVADLTVQVPDNISGTRTAVARTTFSSQEQRAAIAVVGVTVRVLVDPANPATVTVVPPA